MTWRIPTMNECDPGIAPTEYNVLIAPAEFQERTAGGIIIPDAQREREDYATVQGRLVAVSPVAFTFEKWPEDARRPEPGDAVFFGKYAGSIIEGRDGRKYKLVKDQDIAAILEEAVSVPAVSQMRAPKVAA